MNSSISTPITRSDLRRTLFVLALPVLFEQFLNFLIGFYDVWLAGQLSASATSAIGISAYVGWLVSMLFALIGAGTTALVSRSWGADDRRQANAVLNRSLSLAVVLGAIIFGGIMVGAPYLTGLLALEGDAIGIAVRYLRIDGAGHLFTGLSLVGAAALRGAGDTRTPMYILAVVSVANAIVSTVAVFGYGTIPGVGVDGIAYGTVTARVLGGTLMLITLGRGVSGLVLDRSEWGLRGELVRRILRIGGPAAFDGLILWCGQFVFLRIITELPSTAPSKVLLAGHIIAVRMEAITYLPAVAWGAAAATLVGQSLGQNDPDRAARATWEAVLQSGVLAILISLTFVFGAETIYRIMHTDPEVARVAAPGFRMVGLFQVPLMFGIVLVNGGLRGAGETRKPLTITLVSMFLVRLPLGYLFGVVLEGGLLGAWVGMCGDMLLRAILAALIFARGQWKSLSI